ncbi:MAG: hypothetical protein HY919_09315 [Elusimicrobia bacterium]|nr:hypothetical protein [Elusimicrobiota bacterium]
MEKLKKELDRLIDKLGNAKDFRKALETLVSSYPFNEYEYIISHLLAADKLNLQEYLELRSAYHNRNLYLSIFEISAPRGLGDKWARGNLIQIVPEFELPSKELDKKYSNQYDLWLKWRDYGIRIEVKASRAVDADKPDEPLHTKALSYGSGKSFDMNFQQIKTKCADIFIWIAVWRDNIKYWVLSSDEVKKNNYFSKGQHRGNVGEGQLHLNQNNISEFAKYEVKSTEIKNAVIEAYKRQKKIS